MSTSVSTSDLPYLMSSMQSVQRYKDSLESLNKQLGKTTLTGKINSLNRAETLMDYMEKTQIRFADLQKRLIENLVNENLKKLVLESGSKAQVAIDILIRNLFERTADVGFLATDDDIRKFMLEGSPSVESKNFILKRLEEYVKKYSVYDEIVLILPDGTVKAHLDASSPLTVCKDPLIAKTLIGGDDFLETFGHSDIRPKLANSLIYSCKIRQELRADSKTIGVLCLCFKFDDELKGIFSKLLNGVAASLYLIDGSSKILASSHAYGSHEGKVRNCSKKTFEISRNSASVALCVTKKTQGYQGFSGLDWYGHIEVPLKTAFNGTDNQNIEISDNIIENSRLFSDELRHVKTEAEEINDDLNGIVLNGEIIASKQKAYELNPVLDNIRNISENMSLTFATSISDLQKTVITAFLNDVKFLASLSIEIMDRNLYERACDCRWWALNSDFRRVLANKEITAGDRALVSEILSYINRLYTVYSAIFVYDGQGVVIAVSSGKEQWLVGKKLSDPYVSESLHNRDSQKYFVSPFEPAEAYGGQHTYIYAASITDIDRPQIVVGGIGIVFDSQPQFEAMLFDSLPKDEKGGVLADCFGVFIDRDSNIIASSDVEHKIGDKLDIDPRLLGSQRGVSESSVVTYRNANYALGCAVSNGYREYKIADGYINDVIAVFFLKI